MCVCVTDRQTDKCVVDNSFHMNASASAGRRNQSRQEARMRGEEKRVRHDLMILLNKQGRLKYMVVVPMSTCIGNSKDREV